MSSGRISIVHRGSQAIAQHEHCRVQVAESALHRQLPATLHDRVHAQLWGPGNPPNDDVVGKLVLGSLDTAEGAADDGLFLRREIVDHQQLVVGAAINVGSTLGSCAKYQGLIFVAIDFPPKSKK